MIKKYVFYWGICNQQTDYYCESVKIIFFLFLPHIRKGKINIVILPIHSIFLTLHVKWRNMKKMKNNSFSRAGIEYTTVALTHCSAAASNTKLPCLRIHKAQAKSAVTTRQLELIRTDLYPDTRPMIDTGIRYYINKVNWPI